ncbi:hypothetical protein MHH81_20830 [Psychrobacillus sp. FSL H8-0484]|uniref:hypothetical protein n=1 Tax=Psychrobacillus sp. FSL H8-0484 TaxID=2921390 RepID=UPI0030FAB00B
MNFNDLTQKHLDVLIKEIETLSYDYFTINSGKLIVHEVTHYFDHHATLSGQHLLVKVFNALNEYEHFNNNYVQNKKPSVPYILEFLTMFEKWKRTPYRSIYKTKDYTRHYQDWKFNFETFNAKELFEHSSTEKILTVTFKNLGTDYAKVPFTIESLWETSAMWSEIEYHLDRVRLIDEEQGLVELSNIQAHYEAYLYNPNLFVYSIAAHLTSSFCNLGSILHAFKLSKAISSISLNLPLKFYKKIKRTKGTLFKGIVNDLLNSNKELTPTTVFLALLENLVESDIDIFKLIDKKVLDVNVILTASGLPNRKAIEAEILKEMNSLSLNIYGSDSKLYYFHKKQGIDLFRLSGIEGTLKLPSIALVALANKVKRCVFQGWDEEALFEEETVAYTRQNHCEKVFHMMIT